MHTNKLATLVPWQASLYKQVLGDVIKMGATTLSLGQSTITRIHHVFGDELWQLFPEIPLDKLSCNELDVRLKQEWDILQAKKRKHARQSTRGWGKKRGFDGYHNGK